MSNRIDFFQPEQTSIALPAATVSVFLDGVLCSSLVVKEIIRGQYPDFSSARMTFIPNNIRAVDNVEYMFPKGKSLSIRAFYNNLAPADTAVHGYSIFEGQIEESEVTLKSNECEIEVIARDFSAALERITIYGQRIIRDTNTYFLDGFETIFNPDGKANAGSVPMQLHGKSYKLFAGNPKNAKLWKYAEVIQYLLNEYIIAGQLCVPGLERLLALTDRQIVRDLDVTGLSLIDALQRCCDRIALKFKFIPVNEQNLPSQAIVFYKNNTGRTIELNCQRSGQVNISKTNVISCQSKSNFYPVTHKYIGQGDFKVYEATFDLIKAWDGSLEGNVSDHFSPSTNPDFYQVRDVFRKWSLNEAGDYSDSPYNRGNAFDFSSIFESSYSQRRRRFWPSLTTDSQDRSLGYYLQVSYDNGITWRQYEDAFNLMTEECGVWLSSDMLNIDLIIASIYNQLKFRITASVTSDERLAAVVANGPVNSAAPVIDCIITLPRQFKYQKISGQSIFANCNDDQLGKPDEINNTNALYEYIRHLSKDSSGVIETIDVQTPVLNFNYNIGDIVVSSPDSRDIFSSRDKRSVNCIEKVQMDFEKQCCNLKIIRKRDL